MNFKEVQGWRGSLKDMFFQFWIWDGCPEKFLLKCGAGAGEVKDGSAGTAHCTCIMPMPVQSSKEVIYVVRVVDCNKE